MESSSAFDLSQIIDGQPDQKVEQVAAERIQAYLDEGVGLFRGLFFGILFIIPIWALVLWIIL